MSDNSKPGDIAIAALQKSLGKALEQRDRMRDTLTIIAVGRKKEPFHDDVECTCHVCLMSAGELMSLAQKTIDREAKIKF